MLPQAMSMWTISALPELMPAFRNLTIGMLVAALLAVAHAAAVQPALPSIPGGTYDITRYGALGDGMATNTAAIQAAQLRFRPEFS